MAAAAAPSPMQEEASALGEIFSLIDIDRDGGISLDELQDFFKLVSSSHESYAEQMFQADDDRSRTLDPTEFAVRCPPLLAKIGVTAVDALTRCRGLYGARTTAAQEQAHPVEAEVTPEERRRYTVLFDVVDSDGSGLITRAELAELFRVIRPGSTEQDMISGFLSADADGDGSVTLDEFVLFMRRADVPCSLEEATERLREHQRQQERAGGTFEAGSDVPSPKGVQAAAAARQRREVQLQQQQQDDSAAQTRLDLNKKLWDASEAEAGARREIAEEESAAWAELAEKTDELWSGLADAERRDRDAERRRLEVARAQRRKDFFTGGKEAERAYIKSLQQRRVEESRLRSDGKAAQARVQLDDRIESQRNVMLCCGTQFKMLRQLLEKGAEYVREESKREASDLATAQSKYMNDLTSSLTRLDEQILGIGRALIQESMLQHGSSHKQVMGTFLSDKSYDFGWLGPVDSQGADSPTKRRRGGRPHHLSALQLNFGDPQNLVRDITSPRSGIDEVFAELKEPLWAIYRHYAGIAGETTAGSSADTQNGRLMSLQDFTKLATDCRFDVAGGLPVLWVRVLSGSDEHERLGLARLPNRPAEGPRTLDSRIDYNEFANLLLVVACERHISAASASPAHKLRCLVLKEMIPLVPAEARVHGRQSLRFEGLPTVHGILSEHDEIIAQVVRALAQAVSAFKESRMRLSSRVSQPPPAPMGGVCTPAAFCQAYGILANMPGEPPCPLGSVSFTPHEQRLIRHLAGPRRTCEPALELGAALEFCAHRCPALGRATLREALGRAWSELLSVTFPQLPKVSTDPQGSTEAVPFPLLLALLCRMAVYADIAGSVPAPPPPPEEARLPPHATQVYALLQLFAHPGHYVLTL